MTATADALGFGSESGLCARGTHVLSLAGLGRGDVVVHVDYLPAAQEIELLRARRPSTEDLCMILGARALLLS